MEEAAEAGVGAEELMSYHSQELKQERLGMKGVAMGLPKPILLKAVVVGTLSLDSEPLIIVDRVVGIAVRVSILNIAVFRIRRCCSRWVKVSTNASARHSPRYKEDGKRLINSQGSNSK